MIVSIASPGITLNCLTFLYFEHTTVLTMTSYKTPRVHGKRQMRYGVERTERSNNFRASDARNGGAVLEGGLPTSAFWGGCGVGMSQR